MGAPLTPKLTKVDGCVVLEATPFEDHRGTFVESWNRDDFLKADLPVHWAQDNVSTSHAGVVRGLHIQRRNPQGKLVRCLSGAVLDLCLDLRQDSPSFLKWHMQRLEDGTAMYLPPGTAHGFLALEPNSVVYYKCTTLYDRESDGGVNWRDPELDIHWWASATDDRPIMSEKDRKLPGVRAWLDDPRGVYGQ